MGNNGWIKLAAVSFIGLILTMGALAIVSPNRVNRVYMNGMAYPGTVQVQMPMQNGMVIDRTYMNSMPMQGTMGMNSAPMMNAMPGGMGMMGMGGSRGGAGMGMMGNMGGSGGMGMGMGNMHGGMGM